MAKKTIGTAPGRPNKVLEKNHGEIENLDDYRSILEKYVLYDKTTTRIK
jgi:hypothetical protein